MHFALYESGRYLKAHQIANNLLVKSCAMPTEQIRHHLARWPLFSELEPDQIEQLAVRSTVRKFGRNHILFGKGEHLTDFYCIITGLVALAVSAPDGSEKIVNIEEAGRTFGEALLFLDRPAPLSARTLEASEILIIPRKVVLDTVANSNRFTMQLLAGLSARLHHLVDDLESYCLRSSLHRVAVYLISLIPDGSDMGGAATVVLPASKLVVASRLKLTPETFSRVLRGLGEQGLITVAGKSITLLDIPAMQFAK